MRKYQVQRPSGMQEVGPSWELKEGFLFVFIFNTVGKTWGGFLQLFLKNRYQLPITTTIFPICSIEQEIGVRAPACVLTHERMKSRQMMCTFFFFSLKRQ